MNKYICVLDEKQIENVLYFIDHEIELTKNELLERDYSYHTTEESWSDFTEMVNSRVEYLEEIKQCFNKSDLEDEIEKAFWEYDADIKGYNGRAKISERDAFKRQVRKILRGKYDI